MIEVFVCVIHVVYRTPGFSVSKRISKNEACLYFLLWPPLIFQACGSFYGKNHYRGVLEYSLTGRHSTHSQNEAAA